MQYSGIKLSTEFTNSVLPANHVIVYYGSKQDGTGATIPSLNYVANVGGNKKIYGEFGKEWITKKVDQNIDPAVDSTIYICNVTENRTIILPPMEEGKQIGYQFAVKFVGEEGKNVTVKMSGNDYGIKNSFSNSLVNSVVLDENTPQCTFYYDGIQWIASYEGISFPENITPYWKTKILSLPYNDNSINAEQNTRYIPTASAYISLPNPTLQKNFRIAVSTEHLGNSKVTVGCGTTQIKFNGGQTNEVVLDRSIKYIEFIAIDGAFYAIGNNTDFWVTERINTNTLAASKHRYICQNNNGLTITLPNYPSENDRVAVYVQSLTGSNTVKIKSNTASVGGKVIQVGSTTIDADGTASLDIEAPLVYIEFFFTAPDWHVVKLITPSSQRDYKAGTGLTKVGDDTFVLTGTVLNNGTHISIDNNNNINCTLSGSEMIAVNTNHTISIKLPDGNIGWQNKTYVLACKNGVIGWYEKDSL